MELAADEATRHRRNEFRNRIACDLLLAKLFKRHPDHAMAALSGIEPRVIDLEPIELPPEPKPTVPNIIPLPVDPTQLIGKQPTINELIRVVGDFYNVSPLDIVSRRRDKGAVVPRQIVMYLARKMTVHSYPSIARLIGDRDHTCVMHATRRVESMMLKSSRITDEVEIIKLHIAQRLLNRPLAA